MVPIQLLGTAWTVWKLARRRFGPVGALLVTAAIIGGFVYLRPRLAEKAPGVAGVIEDAGRVEVSSAE